MALITDPDQIADTTEYDIDTALRTLTLNSPAGNLSDDGVTLQAIYSAMKDDWKDDPQTKSLIAYPFPMVAITPEQFEFIFDWVPNNDTTRKLIRTGGWREIDTEDGAKLKREYAGIITLGSFEDETPITGDNAYYQIGTDATDTTGSTVSFNFTGPVNEAILTYQENVPADGVTGFDFTTSTITRNDAGDWITDGYKVGSQVTVLEATNSANNGTFVITGLTSTVITVSGTPLTADTGDNAAVFAYNYRNAITLFLRVRDTDPNGKTFSQSTLQDIGVSEVANQVYRFPLSNATDLKITETDANIAANSPYTEVRLRYLGSSYNREIDTTTARNFGILIDVGTYSQANGASATSTLFTSAALNLGTGEALADYAGGTLIIHEGTDKGEYTISGTPVDNAGVLEITLTSALTATETNLSFTMDRATPLTATAEEIYEKVQYQLRQAADIDESGTGVVNGETADELLTFIGDNLAAGNSGATTPNNPNGGGSGVIIEGFDSNDTNRLSFFDNTGSERTFPFVAAGTINFNDNLVNDSGPAEYTMFFQYTGRSTVSDISVTSSAGSSATLTCTGNQFPSGLTQDDYINIQGFTDPNNNGIWRIDNPSTPTQINIEATKVNGDAVSNEGTVAGTLDVNPINSPDAIIVQNNSGSNITGIIGASSISFDFDYDGNVQGGRTAGQPADIIIRAIGTDTAQFVETTGQITQTTGIVFSLVAGLERNYLAGSV